MENISCLQFLVARVFFAGNMVQKVLLNRGSWQEGEVVQVKWLESSWHFVCFFVESQFEEFYPATLWEWQIPLNELHLIIFLQLKPVLVRQKLLSEVFQILRVVPLLQPVWGLPEIHHLRSRIMWPLDLVILRHAKEGVRNLVPARLIELKCIVLECWGLKFQLSHVFFLDRHVFLASFDHKFVFLLWKQLGIFPIWLGGTRLIGTAGRPIAHSCLLRAMVLASDERFAFLMIFNHEWKMLL